MWDQAAATVFRDETSRRSCVRHDAVIVPVTIDKRNRIMSISLLAVNSFCWMFC